MVFTGVQSRAENWRCRGWEFIGAYSWQLLLCAPLPSWADTHSACRSSLLLRLQRTLASGHGFCTRLKQSHSQCFGGRTSLSPCKAPGAAVPPSVRSSASSQHCRGSSSSCKLFFPAFFTGVSQAWMFTSSILLGKHAIQGMEAKINTGIPATFISSFYLKSTSNNLIIKPLKYYLLFKVRY